MEEQSKSSKKFRIWENSTPKLAHVDKRIPEKIKAKNVLLNT